jgi:hypothetical protein
MHATSMMRRLLVLPLIAAAGAAFALAGPANAGEPMPIPAAPQPAAHHVAKPTPKPPANAWTPGAGPRITAKPQHAGGTQVQPLDTPTTVALSASSTQLWPTQFTTLTATANADVGPTPYYLSVYDATDGSYVTICGTGTTCSVSVTQNTARNVTYVAYLSTFPSSNPPPGLIAATAPTTVVWFSVTVNLTASANTTPVATGSQLTATTSRDVGPSPFFIEIYDVTANSFLIDCGFGTSCALAPLGEVTAKTDEFIAYVSNFSQATPAPPGIQAVSPKVFVTWSNSGWRLALGTSGSGTVMVTAVSNQDVGPTPYYIELFKDNGTFLTDCAFGSACSFTGSFSPGDHVVAFVSSLDSSFPPANIQASSNSASPAGL